MTVDEIFKQADEEMKEQLKVFDVDTQTKKRKKSFIRRSIKSFLILFSIAMVIVLGIGIYFGYQSYQQIKADIILQIEMYRFEYEHLDETNLTNAEAFTKKAFTFFTTNELNEISKDLSIEEMGDLLSFTSIEHIDKVPEQKREDYKKLCFFSQYINKNNCGEEPFTDEVKHKYFGE